MVRGIINRNETDAQVWGRVRPPTIGGIRDFIDRFPNFLAADEPPSLRRWIATVARPASRSRTVDAGPVDEAEARIRSVEAADRSPPRRRPAAKCDCQPGTPQPAAGTRTAGLSAPSAAINPDQPPHQPARNEGQPS